uniref:Uncharacterized protein n=1 Tax=Anguilla anguilla TaxID=7936 RepID=A0A0E9VUX0_ANGAN
MNVLYSKWKPHNPQSQGLAQGIDEGYGQGCSLCTVTYVHVLCGREN